MNLNSQNNLSSSTNRTTAKFEKVSFKQFIKDWISIFPEDENNNEYIKDIYDNIKLPVRSTSRSAGYDFFMPMHSYFSAGNEMIIPTGIKCVHMPDDKMLTIHPRSGLGTKYRFVLTNLTGIIDADYSDSKEKEGHILIKMSNDGEYELDIEQGKAFCQAIIQTYYITEDDNSTKIRTGAFGSTDWSQNTKDNLKYGETNAHYKI